MTWLQRRDGDVADTGGAESYGQERRAQIWDEGGVEANSATSDCYMPSYRAESPKSPMRMTNMHNRAGAKTAGVDASTPSSCSSSMRRKTLMSS